MYLDNKDIIEFQKNRFPYLMIDVVENVIPGKSSAGFKNLTANDWFFKCHFPGDPNMPGLLQVEAIVQIAALAILTMEGNKGKVMYLSKLTDSKFKKKVIIGDRLDLYAEVISYKRGIAKYYGKGTVKEQKVCEATFELVLPDEVNKFKINK
ncbi:3-hydroxyacyl-ACP dehydratase FabZ [Alphaproteobacteria bacterium]|nr:3-hydroxyacyl-ACP dehydratase FabZ [Alphaproteobacteria bacterium]